MNLSGCIRYQFYVFRWRILALAEGLPSEYICNALELTQMKKKALLFAALGLLAVSGIVEVSAQNRPETPPGLRPETPPGARPETPPGARPETPPGARPETPPGARPETPPGARPETPPGARSETPPGARPETPPGNK